MAEAANGEELFVPAMIIVSRWEHKRGCPMVYPLGRDSQDNDRVYITLTELAGTLRRFEQVNELAGPQYMEVNLVAPENAQEFIDEKAMELVQAHLEAIQRRGVDKLRIYGFTTAELRNLGRPSNSETF